MPIGFASFPGWQKIYEYEVPAATFPTSIDITGLNLVAQKPYMIVITGQNVGIGARTISMFYNGDFVAANYQSTRVAPVTGVMTQTNAADAVITTAPDAAIFFLVGFLQIDAYDDVYFKSDMAFYEAVGEVLESSGTVWLLPTGPPITRITLTTSLANSIEAGTKIYIFKTV